jgi:CheY-specific phosphatase CheX
MNEESLARIDSFITASTLDLFGSQGVKMETLAAGLPGMVEPLASSIGFTSDNMKGVLVLVMEKALATACLPANLRQNGCSDELLADWVGELSNQLLGRLKTRFVGSGIQIALSTPIVFVGREMRHFFRPSPIQRKLGFGGGGGAEVEFLANFERDFEIAEGEPLAEPGPPEGEVLFF